MVAEERITTKFSGLVGAYGTEEEATFLATQQVDEARHMQFYARFQDEVVAAPATVAEHVERARGRSHPPSADLRRGAGRRPRAPRRRARDLAAKVRFVTLYHLILESTLGLTTFKFATEYLEREGLLPGFVDGYSRIHHDETRHIGYGVWFLRETVRAIRHGRAGAGAAARVAAVGGRSLGPGDDPSGPDLGRLGVSSDDLREFALGGLTRRLEIIGVPIATL